MKIIHKYDSFPYFDFICFPFKNNKHYFDTFHIQMKKEMHLWMHNFDFDIPLRSVH